MNTASRLEEFEKIISYQGDFSQFDNTSIKNVLAARKKYAEHLNNETLSSDKRLEITNCIIWCNQQIKSVLAL